MKKSTINPFVCIGLKRLCDVLNLTKTIRKISFGSRLLLLLLFGAIQNQFAQFTIYNSWDFETETLGDWTDAEIESYFDVIDNESNNEPPVYRSIIVTDTINGTATKVLEIVNLANEVYGFQLDIDLDTDYNELYLTYNWKFSEEFNSTHGGKLTGLGGLPDYEGGNCPVSGQGFRAHNIFKWGQTISSYHYDRTPGEYPYCPWTTDQDTFFFSNGTWYNITQRLVMNTFSGINPNADGIKELWIDGKMIIQEDNLEFMQNKSDTMKIDLFRLSHFYGGDDDPYKPLTECYGYIDNIKTWIPVNDSVSGQELHYQYSILPTPEEIIDRDFYYDSLRMTTGALRNSEYGGTYSPAIEESYLIDAGIGNTVSYTISGGSIGAYDYLILYDGKTTDAPIIEIITNDATITGERVSTRRYMFIKFSTHRDGGGNGFTGTINFLQTVPCSPTDLHTTSVSYNKVDLAWTDCASNEDGFKIERKTGAGNWEQIGTTGTNGTSYSDNTVQGNTGYNYRVRAYNNAGNSDYSNELPVTTPTLAPTLLSPANNSINQPLSLTLSWNVATGAVSYRLQVSNASDFISTVYDQSGITSTSYSVPNPLTEVTKYYWRVNATNAGGPSSWSTVWNFTTLLNAPTALTTTSITGSQVILSWTDNSNNEDGFYLERYNGTTWTNVATLASNTTSYSHTINLIGTSTKYRVRAYKSTTNSANSNELVVAIISPEADAYVRQAYPNTNYNTSMLTVKKHSTDTYLTYLRFSLPTSTIIIKYAKLRLDVAMPSGNPEHKASFVSNDTWGESTITYNNKPSPGSVLATVTVPSSANNWSEFDIQGQVQIESSYGNDKISLQIASNTSNVIVSYYSRSYYLEQRPQLAISYIIN